MAPDRGGKRIIVPSEACCHQYDNGLTLLAEPMEWLESAAFTLLLPAGAVRDPQARPGLGAMVCEMVQRGSGGRSSRQFVEELEMLGVDSSGSVSTLHASFVGAMQAEKLLPALSIYAAAVRRPHLDEEQLEDARQVCLQEIRSHEDDLAHQVMIRLRQMRYPDPYSRVSYGTAESVEQISLDEIRGHFQQFYQPQGTILSVAGRIDWPRLRDHVGELFADWTGTRQPLAETPASGDQHLHLQHPSSQTHIGVAYENVPYAHQDYFQAYGAIGVLSGGMSSRLFMEVREKRGLCYAVQAACESIDRYGSVISYAGTTTERAQETLDVLAAELVRLAEGIQEEELQRLKARIKSSLIMVQESSSSRSGQMAGDWYYLGRVRTLDELRSLIDQLTCASINRYLADHPPSGFRVVTLGEKALEVPRAIS